MSFDDYEYLIDTEKELNILTVRFSFENEVDFIDSIVKNENPLRIIRKKDGVIVYEKK